MAAICSAGTGSARYFLNPGGIQTGPNAHVKALRVQLESNPYRRKPWVFNENVRKRLKGLAGTTGLEPATSDVTGRRSNQLNYVPAMVSREIFQS